VIALKEMRLSAAQLGVVFTCVGVGSLAGAVFALPYLREKRSSNAITSISMAILVVALLAMAFVRQLPALMACATLAGVAWALAGSELWVAGQRVMPEWVRGRMNAFQIMLGQGGIAVGALVWGTGVAHAGSDLTFTAAALLALTVLALGHRFSINFASEASVDETQVFDAVWELHDGESEPIVRHYLATQRGVNLHGYGVGGRTFAGTSSLSRPRVAGATSSLGAWAFHHGR
jgi:transmembrane secretion effector